jgi:hypothetical protein
LSSSQTDDASQKKFNRKVQVFKQKIAAYKSVGFLRIQFPAANHSEWHTTLKTGRLLINKSLSNEAFVFADVCEASPFF